METSGYMVQDLTLLHEFLPQGERQRRMMRWGKVKEIRSGGKGGGSMNKNKKNKEGEQKKG